VLPATVVVYEGKISVAHSLPKRRSDDWLIYDEDAGVKRGLVGAV
jgi:hypothetical protein